MAGIRSRPWLLHWHSLIQLVRHHLLFLLVGWLLWCLCFVFSPEPCIPSVLFLRPCPPPLWDRICGTWPWVWEEARTYWEETSPTVLSSRLRSAFISCSAAGASKRSWTKRSSGWTLIFRRLLECYFNQLLFNWEWSVWSAVLAKHWQVWVFSHMTTNYWSLIWLYCNLCYC